VAQVAAPCREFSIFAANQGAELAAEDLKKALQFLNDGQRGFYAALASNADDAVLHVGDKVYRYQP
jgi:phosphodiesterase/alkaline phosphatase D-like protein